MSNDSLRSLAPNVKHFAEQMQRSKCQRRPDLSVGPIEQTLRSTPENCFSIFNINKISVASNRFSVDMATNALLLASSACFR